MKFRKVTCIEWVSRGRVRVVLGGGKNFCCRNVNKINVGLLLVFGVFFSK